MRQNSSSRFNLSFHYVLAILSLQCFYAGTTYQTKCSTLSVQCRDVSLVHWPPPYNSRTCPSSQTLPTTWLTPHSHSPPAPVPTILSLQEFTHSRRGIYTQPDPYLSLCCCLVPQGSSMLWYGIRAPFLLWWLRLHIQVSHCSSSHIQWRWTLGLFLSSICCQ